ncbi:peptidylglycine alpha-hydroxylating monooxygenase [Aethina tumida]|uniref:peptidylglycine alpha-hydroxylating monooxygenase n=1 Tax=Aethina tumida TaxID=116153 RepID=UPI002148EDE6|nr:peptidylglycine alpha-hydroxylating monooxygenase [Aethina tumida]
MARAHMLRLFCVIFIITFQLTCCSEVKKYPLLMPNVYPYRDELYLCTPVRVVDGDGFYIVGFEPNATMNVAHHMLLFGCSEPGATQNFWNCGEMGAMSDPDSNLDSAPPCSKGSHVIYAWARNAKALKLPDDVGFQVGGNTEIKYLVLQIHYSKKFPEHLRDNSGLNLLYTKQPQTKLAGVVLLATGGIIPPNNITHMETMCKINEEDPNTEIFPFAYRTHTHTLGRVVSGYRVQLNEEGVDQWTLLGKRNPLTPQMFYPVFDNTSIKNGDILAARCTMDSRSRRDVTKVGPTNKDEMCNFYLMYYVENGKPLNMKYCSSEGPPYFYWKSSHLKNIPDYEASTLYD